MIQKFKQYWPFAIGIILLICVGWFVMWALPAYKKVVKDSTEKDQQIATLQREVDSWKNVSSHRTTYYDNGRIKSTTETVVSSGTHSTESATETSNHSLTTHELIVTKRGLFHASAYWNFQTLQPKAYGVDYQMGFIGPSAFVQPDPFIGMVGIGVYF